MPRKQQTFRCEYCGTEYTHTFKYKKRCRNCKTIGQFWETGFGRWVEQLMQRHVYQEAFSEFCIYKVHDVYKRAIKARGYYQIDGVMHCQNHVDICHLYPTGADFISPCAHWNFVLADRGVNRSLGNKVFGFKHTGVRKEDGSKIPTAARRWFERIAGVDAFQQVRKLRVAIKNGKDFTREVDENFLWEQVHEDAMVALRLPPVVSNCRLMQVGTEQAQREILTNCMPVDYDAVWEYLHLMRKGEISHKHATDYGAALSLFWRNPDKQSNNQSVIKHGVGCP